MALKATIYKASLQIADMDRQLYADHAVTIARHPSETDERMMVRLLAFALQVPASDNAGNLDFGKGLWDTDEPELWHKDYTGRIVHWIDIGQPDDKRLLKAAGRADRVTVYSHTASTSIWWNAVASKLTRLQNLAVWQVPAAQIQALAARAQRSMQLQVTVQDGQVWVSDGQESIEIQPEPLLVPTR